MARQNNARDNPNSRAVEEVKQPGLEDPSFTTLKMSEDSLEALFKSDESPSPEDDELFNSSSLDEAGNSTGSSRRALGTREARKKALDEAVARARAKLKPSHPGEDPGEGHAGTMKLRRRKKGDQASETDNTFSTIKLKRIPLLEEEEVGDLWPSWKFVLVMAAFTFFLLGVAGMAAYAFIFSPA